MRVPEGFVNPNHAFKVKLDLEERSYFKKDKKSNRLRKIKYDVITAGEWRDTLLLLLQVWDYPIVVLWQISPMAWMVRDYNLLSHFPLLSY